MTDSAIARQVVAPLDLDLRTDPSAEAREEEHEFVFQHNQYDLLFLKDRARRIGYELVVEETPDGNPRLYFGPSDSIRERPESQLTYGRTLIDFQPQLSTAQQERSEEHTSALQTLMRTSYAVFSLIQN